MITTDLRLNRAMFGIESSRWAGSGFPHARTRLKQLTAYVDNQFAGLSIGVHHQKVIHVTLGGKVGTVTISIHNSLPYPVRVGLQVTSNSETVTAKQHDEHELYLVPPGSSTGVKLNVSAATTGKAKVTLRLGGRSGKLLPNPPDKPLTLELSATNLGTVALVIFAAALAVFVIASAAQALRRGRGGTDPAGCRRGATPGGRPPGPPRGG